MTDLRKRRKQPIYERICQSLTREINSGKHQPHDLFITMDEICQRFGTSRITAQRAMIEMVKEGLVYTKRGSGVFVAPPPALETSKLVSFIFWSTVADGALPLIIQGAESVARQHGYNMILCNTEGDTRIGYEYVDRMLEQKVDGALFDIPYDEREVGPIHDLIQRLESRRVPVVLTQKRFLDETLPMSYVVADNYGGSVKVIEHLCRLGHKRIAGIFQTVDSGSLERVEGYRGALLKSGAAYIPDLLKFIDNMDHIAALPGVIDELLAAPKPPTAIACLHDLIARAVIQILQARGVRVPDDMAVVGFDDLPFSRYLDPPLTTVRQPLDQIGREAMRILLRRMQGEFNLVAHRRVDTILEVRESCGVKLKKTKYHNDEDVAHAAKPAEAQQAVS